MMTQFKRRAGTRPTNSQHLPTHSKERKQQGRGANSVLTALCPTNSFLQDTLHSKTKYLSHQPFYLHKKGVEQQKASWSGWGKSGPGAEIQLQRAQSVCTR